MVFHYEGLDFPLLGELHTFSQGHASDGSRGTGNETSGMYSRSMLAESVIAANLWNVFTRLSDDEMHHEAVTSRPLLQSCVARLSRHARYGIVTIYAATREKSREIYRTISAFLSIASAASQLNVEERRQRIIAHAFDGQIHY